MQCRNEVEVEQNLIGPLFRDVLGYPEGELVWRPPVEMHLGRKVTTKEADLLAKHHGDPVVTVDAKHPREAVQSYIGQLDSYAFHLKTPYSIITNGHRFILRRYYDGNNRSNVLDKSVEELARDEWQKVRNLIAFNNISTAIVPENELPLPMSERLPIIDGSSAKYTTSSATAKNSIPQLRL
jgi:predicted type IV restriction endonuclease